MAQSAIDTLKAWAAPALVAALVSVLGYVAWDKNAQLDTQSQEVTSLKAEVLGLKGEIANVRQSQSDRAQIADKFYAATDDHFKDLTDSMNTMALAVNRLVTLQEQRDKGR